MKDKVRDINCLKRPNFRYVTAAATDIRATIRREQRRLDAIEDAKKQDAKALDIILAKRSIGTS